MWERVIELVGSAATSISLAQGRDRTRKVSGVSAVRLLFPILLLPAAALAGTGFDGTWKTNMESLKTTGKPLVLLLAGGEYTCSSCNPPYTVKADGAEHKVTGQAYFDIAKVKVTGPNSADIVLKQG
ncbi:MAG TPA: hypothetical protein VIH50_01230, partial [Steroidobacteraceae bacterium]